MKTIIISFISVLITLSVSSQTATDKKAKAILDEVSQKTKLYKTISIDFTYTMLNKANNINQSKKGSVIIKGEKFKMKMAGQIVIFDGTAIYTYIEDAEEVQINAPTEESINPSQLLTGYDKDYKSKFIKEETSNGVTYQIIDLTPAKQSKAIARVRLKINKSKKQIASSTLYDKNGSTYTYLVNKFITDTPIDDTMFAFKKSDFPNAEVIDMR